jgi:hypothetical protein
MGMQTDVKSVPVAATATVYNQRTRLKGLLVMPGASAGLLVIRDGGASGTILMSIPTLAGDSSFPVIIPGEGVLCYIDIHVTVSNATATVFHG